TANGFTIDFQMDRTVDGSLPLDVNALGGSVFIQGDVNMSAHVHLHLVFGGDAQGFFLDPNGPMASGQPGRELAVSDVQVDGANVTAGGDLGIADITLSNLQLMLDPGVQFTVDLQSTGPDPFTGATDGLIRPYDLPELADAIVVQVTGTGTGHD